MKIDRLIGIITLLLQQEKVTAPELAAHFEVSRRTINRDIEDLCKAGIPLVTSQGYGGGISIADGYKLDKSLFTREELQTILAGLQGIDSVSTRAYLPELLRKLSRKGDCVTDENIVMIHLASHYGAALTPKIETIKTAILDKHPITFRYCSHKGESLRKIEPYRLVFQWADWYVLGYCLEKQAYRMFKLNRLWDLHTDPATFQPRQIPEETLRFSDYFTSSRIHLKAVFTKKAKHRLIEEYGVGCYHVTQQGMLAFEWDFASYDNMREWIFSFGDQVRILEPKALQDDRKKQAENILNMDTPPQS